MPAGWEIAYEECGGRETAATEGWTGTVGTCQEWPFPAGDPAWSDTGHPYVQGWRKVADGYVWPNWHAKTRAYERTTGTEPFAFSPPEPRVVPVPDPAWPLPVVSPQRQPLPLRPRPQRITAPPLSPWAPEHLPLERPLNDVPLEVPWRFTPTLPGNDPDGEPIRGPQPGTGPGDNPGSITEPFEDAEEWNRALPGPGPSARPGPWPGPASGASPGPRPWQRANFRTIAKPEEPISRNRNPHNALPPYKGTQEVKPYIKPRVLAAAAKWLGRATEGCDVIDAYFTALPLGMQQQYDSTKFTRGRPLSSASDDMVGNAGRGAGSSSSGSGGGSSNTAKSGYSSNRSYSGRTFAQKRKAYNDKQKELPPWARSKYGRKATCQAKAKAVYDNLNSVNHDKAFWNMVTGQARDSAIGNVAKGAQDHAKQTGRLTGWISRMGG